MPVQLTAGHTLSDPHTPEHLQPTTWGWALNYRVATIDGLAASVGLMPGTPHGIVSDKLRESGREGAADLAARGAPALLMDYYIRKEVYDESKSYPFRSAEFYPDRDEITRVAFLRRDPELDNGALVYGRDEPCYRYTFTGNQLGGSIEATTAIDPAASPDAEQDRKDREFSEMFMRCLRNPAVQTSLKQYMQGGAAPVAAPPVAAAPAAPPAPPHMPEAPKEPEKKEDHARTAESIRYSRLEAEIAKLRDEHQKINYERDLAAGRALVAQLASEGYYFTDVRDGIKYDASEREAERLARMPEADRQARAREVRLNFTRDPAAGPMVRLAEETGPRDPDALSQRTHDAAMQYMRQHDKWDWEAAIAAVTKSA